MWRFILVAILVGCSNPAAPVQQNTVDNTKAKIEAALETSLPPESTALHYAREDFFGQDWFWIRMDVPADSFEPFFESLQFEYGLTRETIPDSYPADESVIAWWIPPDLFTVNMLGGSHLDTDKQKVYSILVDDSDATTWRVYLNVQDIARE